jgi:hypothetical protein
LLNQPSFRAQLDEASQPTDVVALVQEAERKIS